jgi:hypothetical protein
VSHDVKKVAGCKQMRKEFKDAFKNLARHLEIWANGDPAKLQNLGFDTRQQPKKSVAPTGPLSGPTLNVKHGALPGTMIVRMSVLHGAVMYELHVATTDPN